MHGSLVAGGSKWNMPSSQSHICQLYHDIRPFHCMQPQFTQSLLPLNKTTIVESLSACTHIKLCGFTITNFRKTVLIRFPSLSQGRSVQNCVMLVWCRFCVLMKTLYIELQNNNCILTGILYLIIERLAIALRKKALRNVMTITE